MVHEKLLFKRDLSYRSYKNTSVCERLLSSCSAGWSFALFQKPLRRAFVRVIWPHYGAFAIATILKSKDFLGIDGAARNPQVKDLL